MTKYDKRLVEAVARAIAGDTADEIIPEQGNVQRPEWTYFRHHARAVLDAINASGTHRVAPLGMSRPGIQWSQERQDGQKAWYPDTNALANLAEQSEKPPATSNRKVSR